MPLRHIHGIVSNLLTRARYEPSVAYQLDAQPSRTLAALKLRYNTTVPVVGGFLIRKESNVFLKRYADNTLTIVLPFETRLLIAANYPR
jgi:hypothetical protein